MKYIYKTLGITFVFWGLLNLASLFIVDFELLKSPISVTIRYTLLVIAGIGFFILRRWGFYVFIFSVSLNLLLYFTVYNGEGGWTPLWYSVIPPALISALVAYKWRLLK